MKNCKDFAFDISEVSRSLPEEDDETSDAFLQSQIDVVIEVLFGEIPNPSEENILNFEDQSELEDVSEAVKCLEYFIQRGKMRRKEIQRQMDEVHSLLSETDTDFLFSDETGCSEDSIVYGKKCFSTANLYLRSSILLNETGSFMKSVSNGKIPKVRSIDDNERKRLLSELNYIASSGYSGLHQSEKAFFFAEKSYELTPESSLSNTEYGRALANRERENQRALEYLNKGIELNKNDEKILPYARRCWVLRDMNKIEECKRDISKCLAIVQRELEKENFWIPNEFLIYSYQAIVYQREKKIKKSIIEVTKSILLEPRRSSNYNNRGNNFKNMNLYDKAISDFNRSQKLLPDISLHMKNRGHLYLLMNRLESALKDLNRSIELDNRIPTSYLYRGIVLRKLKDFKNAESDFTKFIDLSTSNESVVYSPDYYYTLTCLSKSTAIGYRYRGVLRLFSDHDSGLIDLLISFVINSDCTFFKGLRKGGVKAYNEWKRMCVRGVRFFTVQIGLIMEGKESTCERIRSIQTGKRSRKLGILYYFRALCHRLLSQHEQAIADLLRSEDSKVREERISFMFETSSPHHVVRMELVNRKGENVSLLTIIHLT